MQLDSRRVQRVQMQRINSWRLHRPHIVMFTFLTTILCADRTLALVGGNGIIAQIHGPCGITRPLASVAQEKCSLASPVIGGSDGNSSLNYVRALWIRNSGFHGDFRDDWPKFEFNWFLLLGTVIGMSGSVLGSLGGIGGAAFFLPMFDFIIGFDAKTSTALSKTMVMGGAISTFFHTIGEKHPTETRPVINYDIAMLFEPMILLGISIGVILNVTLPEWLVTIFLCVLLTNLSKTSFRKAFTLWKLENSQMDSSFTSATNSGILNDVHTTEYVEISSESSGPGVQDTLVWEWFPKARMGMLILTWLIFLLLQVIKEVYIEGCSLWYWLLTLLQVPVAFGATIWEAYHQQKRDHLNDLAIEGGHTVEEGSALDRRWWTKLSYSFIGLVAGLAGGLLGVGGGGIMGPAFLEFGLSPQVSSATASFIMIFSSSLSVVEFYLLGRLPGDFALYFTVVAFVASALSQVGIKETIYKSGKISILVFILATCIASSGLVLGTLGIMNSYRQWISGEYMGLKGLCEE